MLASVLEKEGISSRVFYPDNLQEIVGLVNKYKPKIIGVSTETMNAFEAYQIPAVLNNTGCDVFKVIGGYHASFEYQASLKAGYDCVVIGEGESTFLELVIAVLEHRSIQDIQGIALFNQAGVVIKTSPRPWIENLDLLPFPNWVLSYLHLPSNLGIIYATRGCPIGCNFCVTSEYYGHHSRFRSAESIIEEIECRNYRMVYFQDDDFTNNLDRIKHLHDHFSKTRQMPIMVIYSRMDTIARHPEIAPILARMGVKLVYFGIESHHQASLNFIHKGLRIEDQAEALGSQSKPISMYGRV